MTDKLRTRTVGEIREELEAQGDKLLRAGNTTATALAVGCALLEALEVLQRGADQAGAFEAALFDLLSEAPAKGGKKTLGEAYREMMAERLATDGVEHGASDDDEGAGE